MLKFVAMRARDADDGSAGSVQLAPMLHNPFQNQIMEFFPLEPTTLYSVRQAGPHMSSNYHLLDGGQFPFAADRLNAPAPKNLASSRRES
jgi:hypothetical protein